MSNRTEQADDLNLDSFRRRHAEWLGRVPAGPLYCLPEKAILPLGQSQRGQPALLDILAVTPRGISPSDGGTSPMRCDPASPCSARPW